MLGIKVCEILRNSPDNQGYYITMLSARKISSDNQADGLNSGAGGYIARPVSNRELISRVYPMVRLIRTVRKIAQTISELETALKKIKVLSGIVPICMH